jgi:glycerol-3-phosphate dehydrogenase
VSVGRAYELFPWRHLHRLRNEFFDVLVIGGGATGCGAALDAATRGLSVALVERADFASGTSSRSTKLIHGGVRYLERAVKNVDRTQFRLVREALRERALLLRLAPHLTREVPIFVPLYRHRETPYYLLGLKLYDRLAGRHAITRSKFVRRRAAQDRFPELKVQVDPELTGRRLRGGVIYYDGQFDDARMNIALALTAAREGAALANYVAVTSLSKSTAGRVDGADVEDRLSGERWHIRARVVVNAAGPQADQVRGLDRPEVEPLLSVSTGTHIVLGSRFPPPAMGFLIPRTQDRRVMFVLPWLGHTLIGTTDVPSEVVADPTPVAADIDYLIAHARRYLNLPVTAGDVKAAWSGLRPLLRDERASPSSRTTAGAARDYRLEVAVSGLVTVAGGKWTTYRSMAVSAINRATGVGGLPAAGSRTRHTALVGAVGYSASIAADLIDRYALAADIASHLQRAYGAEAHAVIAAPASAERLIPGYPVVVGEVSHAVRREGACKVMDVLARRTRLAFLDPAAAADAVAAVAKILAAELGWSAQQQHAEEVEAQHALRAMTPAAWGVANVRDSGVS